MFRMYSPPSSHRRQAVKQAAIYAVMTLTVVSVVAVLILVTLGYRFDRADGAIVQGGLVQFSSVPSSATITLDSKRLGSTSARATIAPGQHTVMMSRDGYHPWQKTIDVRRGSVLWLNYARLIPTSLPVESVADLPDVTSSLGSPNHRLIAMTTEPSSPIITLADVNSSSPTLSTLQLPESSYSQPDDEVSDQKFRVAKWDASSRYLLVEHSYDGKTEWIVADTDDVASSVNISSILDAPMTNVRFSLRDDNALYAIVDGDIRKIDTQAATISAPLVRDVAEFSLLDRSVITYTTTFDKQSRSHSVGYLHEGADEPRIIQTFEASSSTPLHVSVGKYYDSTYLAIAHGSSVEVLEGPLPNSGSDSELVLSEVHAMELPEGVDYLSSKTDGRFFVAQHGNSFTTYDLELQKATTTNLRGEASLSEELGWIDSYRVWAEVDGVLQLYEFDGANQHDIMAMSPGQSPTLTSNGRFLYAPTTSEDGSHHLSRVRLILP